MSCNSRFSFRLSEKGLRRFALSAILLVVVLAFLYYYFTISSKVVKKTVSEQAIENQVNYLISLKRDKCQAIEGIYLGNKSVEVLSEQGNANLLYGFVELYKITNNTKFLSLADEQARCLEGKILPLEFDPIARRIPGLKNLSYEKQKEILSQQNLGITPDIDIDNWGNILRSLSDFYALRSLSDFHEISLKQQNSSYLKEIADYISSKLENQTFLKDGTVKGKAILSLVYYYDISKDKQYLEKAKFYLNAIPIKAFEDYRPIYYEIYARDSNFSINSSVFKEVIALQNADGSTGDRDKNFTTLMFSWNMDLCQRFLKSPECKEAFLNSSAFLLKQIQNEPGLLISGQRKLSELDSLLAVILVRNLDEVKNL
jgi:hypothetical protein